MVVLNGEFFASLPVKRAEKREDKPKRKSFPLSKEVLNGKRTIKAVE